MGALYRPSCWMGSHRRLVPYPRGWPLAVARIRGRKPGNLGLDAPFPGQALDALACPLTAVPGIAGGMPGELVVRILGNVGIAAEVFESVPEGMEYEIVREPQVFGNITVEPAAQHFTVGLVSASGLEKGPQAFLSAGFDGFHIGGELV